jgi:phosphoribosylformimino-5-aminoimidazole carboxamide ribotide isomerase
MEIIPAVDVRGGLCVRLIRGDFGRETVFDGKPEEHARRWADAGATRLHVVDLDGARRGASDPENLRAIASIARALTIPVQTGGGIRTMEDTRRVLDLGVDRVVLGTAIASDDDIASGFFGAFGELVIAGVDARAGRVSVDGWSRTVSEEAPAFAARMVGCGARRLVFTDISRDGMQNGPNMRALRDVALAARVPVIASGGIGSLGDVQALVRSGVRNLEGIIIGRALYSGQVSLPEAIEAARCRDGNSPRCGD